MSGGDYLTQGVHDDIDAEIYHLDPCPEPSLSAGIAHRLLTRSPLHAWTAHPRLNPAYRPKDGTTGMDFGTCAHSLLLQGVDVCEIVEANDWRTAVAREARDSARKTGLVPLLRKDWDRMCAMLDAVNEQISRLGIRPLPLRDGKPEQTLVWQEDGVWCRARLDWLHEGGRHISDLKSTATSANPYDWARRRLFTDGKDLQAAHYLAGLRAVTGETVADWRFVVVEVEPPYAMSVISLSPAALEIADQKRQRALTLWRRSLEADEWPGYPTQVAYAEPPPWAESEFLEAHWEPEEAAA